MQGNPDSRIQENFTCGIRNRELWNPEYTSRNPESPLMIEIQIPDSTYKDWKPAPGIQNPWHGI